MAEDEADGDVAADGAGEKASSEYDIYLKCENLLDKLKILDYEDRFLTMSANYRTLQRFYFVNSTNVGEQFHMFTSLAAWLIRIGGKDNFPMPQEFDDPNATIATILSELRAKGAAPDFPANRLKSGSGDAVLFVLDSLADAALVQENFQWQKLIPPPVEDDDVDVDKEEELSEQAIEEDEASWADDDDDDAALVDLTAPTAHADEPLQAILTSDVDVNAWKDEVARATPMLKITIKQDAKDWRMHLDQMQSNITNMSGMMTNVCPQLDTIARDVDKALERIETREKLLNQQMSTVLSSFKQVKDRRAEVTEKYKSASVGIDERTATLQRISDDIDQIKQQIEEQGSRTSDGAPMVKIKQALAKMEEDVAKMNVQIGVLEQTIMQSQLRDRVSYSTEAYPFF